MPLYFYQSLLALSAYVNIIITFIIILRRYFKTFFIAYNIADAVILMLLRLLP